MSNNKLRDLIVSEYGIGELITYAKIRVFEIECKEEDGNISTEELYEKYYWERLLTEFVPLKLGEL